MSGVPRQTDFGSRIERLESGLRALQRQSTLSSASISGGALTIRRGGKIVVLDGGSIIGEGSGILDWDGNGHFGGDLLIDGDTTLGGNLTFGDDVIPPEALKRRTEAATFGSNGVGVAVGRNQSVTVVKPSWAQTVSCMAIGTTYVASAISRFSAKISIDGNVGPITEGVVDGLATTVPSLHRRDFSPAGNFTVQLQGTQQGLNPDAVEWQQVLTVMCVFIRQS